MLHNTALLFVSSLTLLAAANPLTPRQTTINQCNTGSTLCCSSTSSASDPSTAALLGLLGVVVQGVNVLVGLGCTPISVVGVGSGVNCAQQPVCCTSNSFNGVIGVGCTPISL